MRDEDEVCDFACELGSVLEREFGVIVGQLPHKRYRHACAMSARQEAFKIAGASWQEYFEEHRGRLIEDAKELISCEQQHHRQ